MDIFYIGYRFILDQPKYDNSINSGLLISNVDKCETIESSFERKITKIKIVW